MLNGITIKILIGIAISVGLYIGYLNYTIYQLEIDQIATQDSLYISTQNASHFEEQLVMKEDTIQNFSVRVTNLQNDNTLLAGKSDVWKSKYYEKYGEMGNLQERYYVLSSQYKVLIDSIFVKDSTKGMHVGNLVIVPFQGKKKKTTYIGKTTYNLLDKSASYELGIITDPINITSSIFLTDDQTDLRHEIYADGILLDDATTTVDSSVYLLLRRMELPETYVPGMWDYLSVGTSMYVVNENFLAVQELDGYTIDLTIWASYSISDRWSVTVEKTLFNKSFSAYASYGMSVAEIFGKK